jgi:hypothetical protein
MTTDLTDTELRLVRTLKAVASSIPERPPTTLKECSNSRRNRIERGETSPSTNGVTPRPQDRVLNHWRILVAAASLIALSIVATSLVLSSTGPGMQYADAAWSQTPTIPAPGQVASAESTCHAQIPVAASQLPVREQFISDPGAWHVVGVDTRGRSTLVGLTATSSTGTNTQSDQLVCLVDGPAPATALKGTPTPEADITQTTTNGGPAEVPVPAPGHIAGGGSGWDATYGNWVAMGRVGAGVTGVTLVLRDGTKVEATVVNGYYMAWWPGNGSNGQQSQIVTEGLAS